MSKRQKPQYTYHLRNARGFRSSKGKAVTLSKAYEFQLFYGKRKVTPWLKFKAKTTVKQREKFLFDLVAEIYKRFQEILKKRRIKKRQERYKELEKRDRRRARSALLKLKKEKEKRSGQVKEVAKLVKKERLLKSKVRFEESDFGADRIKDKVIGKVQYVPVETGTSDYKKEIITKKVASIRFGELDLKVLDFSLKEHILVDKKNIKVIKHELQDLFSPHVIKFFKENQTEVNAFIFRVKYDMFLSDGTLRSQGVSANRIQLEDGDLDSFLQDAIFMAYEKFESLSIEEYLGRSLNGNIEVTGFTLEVIEKGDYP